MKEHRLVGVLAAALFLLCLTGIVLAQTTQRPGTRSTPCDPLTPNNSLCLTWTAPATNIDGTPTVLPLVYRLEQQFNGGTWTQTATGLTSTRYYAKNLPLGTYVFRVYANCTGNAGCTESAPTASNSKDSTAPVIQPGPPTSVLVVQVVIGVDHAPVFTVLSDGSRSNTVAGFARVGIECTGPVLFKYRGKEWRTPAVWKPWGVAATAKVAAPCA